jgi:tetratricopeptide (TPR) repeat protein
VPALAELATDTGQPAIWRATAMEALGGVGGREATQTMAMLLYDDDSIIRTSTVRSLQFLSLPQRFQLLTPLLEDPVLGVRMEVANALAGVPLDQVPEDASRKLESLFKEYERVQRQHADMPSVLLQLGLFYTSRGDTPSAEAMYREALQLNHQLLPAYLNLADLLRAQSRDDEARAILQEGLKLDPDNGNTLHSLGLLETRAGNTAEALDYLGRAAALESQGIRHRFVYAIALHDLGRPRDAINTLQNLLGDAPRNDQVLLALANYHAELGERVTARNYARQLAEAYPDNPGYQQLLKSLY